MGLTISVYGEITKDDPVYQKHAKVLLACHEAGIQKLPEETAKFFDSECVETCVLEEHVRREITYKTDEENTQVIHRVKISELPKEVEYICFYIGY